MKFTLACVQSVSWDDDKVINQLEFEGTTLQEVLLMVEQFLVGSGFYVPKGMAEGSLWWQEKQSDEDPEC